MSSDVAVIGLTFDGTDIQEEPWGTFLELYRGLNEPPQVRGVDTVIPGLPGRRWRNRMADRRFIELRGWVAGIGADEAEQKSDFRSRWTALLALFNPIADPAVLEATLEDGTVTTITARTTPDIIPIQIVPAMASVSIQLESVDPLWSHEGS